MTDQERARMEGFFDGLMGRASNSPHRGTVGLFYYDGYEAGSTVWLRPRRKRRPAPPTESET